jgi:membrane protease YdiL (CAAX protease family)
MKVIQGIHAGGWRVKWQRIIVFLSIVFILSWGFGMLFDALSSGAVNRGALVPPLGMFIPALVAICLRIFFYSDSKYFRPKKIEGPNWILFGFIVLVLIQFSVAIAAVTTSHSGALLSGIGTWTMIGWTLVFIRLYKKRGEDCFSHSGLQLGNITVGIRLAICVVLFLMLQGILDVIFGLGQSNIGISPELGVVVPERLGPIVILATFVLAIIGTPLGSMALLFGEEYGWRGFLMDELAPIGKRKAALVIGFIWGVWHIPIIISGAHTYPPTEGGFILAGIFFTLWGFFQSYVVLKTNSIWAAAFMHGIVNGLYYFIRTYVVSPDNKLLSFGIGLYRVICLVIVVMYIWKDAVWHEQKQETKEVFG